MLYNSQIICIYSSSYSASLYSNYLGASTHCLFKYSSNTSLIGNVGIYMTYSTNANVEVTLNQQLTHIHTFFFNKSTGFQLEICLLQLDFFTREKEME